MVEILARGAASARPPRPHARAVHRAWSAAGYDQDAELDPVVVEAVGASVYSMMYEQIREYGAERLPEILPADVFVLLGPFVGNAEAVAVANDDQARD